MSEQRLGDIPDAWTGRRSGAAAAKVRTAVEQKEARYREATEREAALSLPVLDEPAIRLAERAFLKRRVLEIIDEMQGSWHSAALESLRERIEREIEGECEGRTSNP